MIHNENIRKADEAYEVRHDDNGNAIHVFIKDGEAIVFPTMWDLVSHCYNAVPDVERFYLDEEELALLYIFDLYDYYSLKEVAQSITNGDIPPPPTEVHQVI